MQALRKELEDLRRDNEQDSRRARKDSEESMMLRKHCESLENECVSDQF